MSDTKNREFVRTLHGMIADFLRDNPDIDRSYYQEIWDWLEKKEGEENEDERIRKGLISYLKIDMESNPSQAPQFYAAAIAYLEKQKELPFVKDVMLGYPAIYFYDGERMHFQGNPAMEEKQKEHKPILEVFGFKVGDAVRLKNGDGRKHIIKSFEEVKGLGPNFYRVEFEDNSARDGIYPGEEYPNGYYTQMEKFEEEQKPEESITDKEINQAMDDIHNFKIAVTDLAKTFNIRIDHDRDIDWHNFCASLLTCLKRHAEWSEEDEAMLENVLGTYKTLEDMLNLSTGQDRDILESMNFERDWLKGRFKFLRPHPQWKPTKEQLGALLEAAREKEIDREDGNVLYQLYDQLKKL